jgi:TPR repeat protein
VDSLDHRLLVMVNRGNINNISKSLEKEATLRLLKDASNEDLDSINQLGISYECGSEFLDRNPYNAILCFERAADKDHLDAMVNLAMISLFGMNVTRNEEKSLQWLTTATNRYYRRAQAIVGVMKFFGIFIEQDAIAGVDLFQLSAQQEDGFGMVCHAMCYELGLESEQSEQRANRLYSKALKVSQNNAEAEREYQYLKSLLLQVADTHVEAVYLLAILHDKGIGMDKQADAAKQYYHMIIEHDETSITAALVLKRLGDLETKSKESFSFYFKSAQLELASAQSIVGNMYDHGDGVIQSTAQAIQWYTEAANQNNADAIYYLGTMYQEGRGVDIDTLKAINLLLRASQLGHYDAGVRLRSLQSTVSEEWNDNTQQQEQPLQDREIMSVYI